MSQNNRDGDMTATIGSGNVFADLGLPNPELELLKSKLVGKIGEVIEARCLTQAAAGELIGLAQPKVSELLKGRFEAYSVDRLYRYLTRLGVSVSIALEDQPDWAQGGIEVIEAPQHESDRAPVPTM
jgi:predicted XRE-type DNA-binding protein